MTALQSGFIALCAILTISMTSVGWALSVGCAPTGVDTSFHNFDDAPELYRVYTGTWQPLEPVPTFDSRDNDSVRYQFTGQVIGRDGPSGQVQTLSVDVQSFCVPTWCLHPAAGERRIVFLEDVGGNAQRFRFSEGPCGGSSFPPSSANVTALVDCFNGRNCPRPDLGVSPPTPPRPSPVGDSCGANGHISQFVGSRVENVPAELYPPRVRFIRPGDAVTMDFMFDRLNVELSNTAVVQRFRCG